MSAALMHLWEMGGFMLLALPLWILGRTLWLLHRKEAPRPWREFLLTGFVLYVLGLLSQTLTFTPWGGPEMTPLEFARWRWAEGYGINLTPGYTIRSMWERSNQTIKILNLAGNVLIFAPIGFLPPLLWKKARHLFAAVGLSAVVSFLIEFVQLFLGRSVDVDDLILNTLGGLLGYLLFCLIPKKWKG